MATETHQDCGMVERVIRIRPIEEADRPVLPRLIRELWGTEIVLGRGTAYEPATLSGFFAEAGDDPPGPVGLLTYAIDGDALEIVTINAFERVRGAGTALIEAAVDAAHAHGCTRLRLTTTNDNLDALRFYQRRGFRLTEVRPGAVDRARQTKPEIPELGEYGIPLRDELDLEREIPPTAVPTARQ
jgi:GNAT superfamily N-acetyltransferase